MGRRRVEISAKDPVYMIGVVSDLLEMPVWTLRTLEREGLVRPKRFRGKTRMYSMEDIRRLEYIHYLMEEEGVNMSGIKIILHLKKEE